ncbi:NAD(P)/FAD-dependent oxidoreductase [Mesorhizobium sp. 10J20-29]
MADSAPQSCDVAIVGGGPAGLAAAVALRKAGVASVVVLEREAQAGGIPRHCGHYPFGMREFNRVLRGPDYAARLVARALKSGVDIRTSVTVTALDPGGRLGLSTPEGAAELAATRVLLCTGVREKSRAARLIGGEKPGGVLSTGALQGLVYLNHQKPFSRPVVLGTELVSFSALLTCRHMGIRPVAMVEPASRVTARWPTRLLPKLLRIPLLLDTGISAIHGGSKVTGVDLVTPDGGTRHIDCDGVIVTGAFLPEASLLRASHLAVDPASGGPDIDQFGRCSDPTYFAAGNLLRAVETAGWSWAEGRRAGNTIAHDLKSSLPEPREGLRLVMASDALKYAVPQRVAYPAGSPRSATKIQLRVTRPVEGRLGLRIDGTELWSKPLSAVPERRLTVPVSMLPDGRKGTAEFFVREQAK